MIFFLDFEVKDFDFFGILSGEVKEEGKGDEFEAGIDKYCLL